MNQLKQLSIWLLNYNNRHSLDGYAYLKFYDDHTLALWSGENGLIVYFGDINLDDIRDYLTTK